VRDQDEPANANHVEKADKNLNVVPEREMNAAAG
jgi:hypothetical protein